ncbi:hypothetical protein H6P81_004538 [Aristolochia fimbriata]|uniref:TAFII55 protein conserved region domain-containing protein n=1 Tax=Aristolochia fimbriata TaxID=158543 RepID=A0AAV7FHP2_ARIFI|nr:hypothetical protein H6P81_004538 [Aristolochia fimbriata]
MEEQFILRVPAAVAERIDHFLSENVSSPEDRSLDLSFSEDGRSGTFTIGNDSFPATQLDLPCIVESYKTYDDNVLVKVANIGQMVMVQENSGPVLDEVEFQHGLTPPMKDVRQRRFRREPELNPELVQQVEKDLLSIMAGGTIESVDILYTEVVEQGEEGEGGKRDEGKKTPDKRICKSGDAPEVDPGTNTGEPDRSESEDSDDSV